MGKFSNLFCGGRKKKNDKRKKGNGGEKKGQDEEGSLPLTVEENQNNNGITVNIVADKVTIGTEEIQWKNGTPQRKSVKGEKDLNDTASNDGLEEAAALKLHINPTNESDSQLVTGNSKFQTYDQATDKTAEDQSCQFLESGYGSKKEQDDDMNSCQTLSLNSFHDSEKGSASLEVDGPNKPFESVHQPQLTGPKNNVKELRSFSIVSDRYQTGSDTYGMTDEETGEKGLISTGKEGSNLQMNIPISVDESSGVSHEQLSDVSCSVNSVLSAAEELNSDRNGRNEHNIEQPIDMNIETANGGESEQNSETVSKKVSEETAESNQEEINNEDGDGLHDGDNEVDAEVTPNEENEENKDAEGVKIDTEEEEIKRMTPIHAIRDLGHDSMDKNFAIAMRGDNECKIVNGREIGSTARDLSGFIRDVAVQRCF